MSLATIGAGLGTITMAPLETLLLNHYGSFGALLITGGIVFNIIVAGALFRPPPKPKHEDIIMVSNTIEKFKADQSELFASLDRISVTVEREKGNDELWSSELNDSVDEIHSGEQDTNDTKIQPTEGKCLWLKSKCVMFSNGTYWIYLLNQGTMPFVLMTPMILLPSLALEIGASKDMASILLSLLGLADIVGRFLFGFLFDLKMIRDKKRRRLMFGIIGKIAIFSP